MTRDELLQKVHEVATWLQSLIHRAREWSHVDANERTLSIAVLALFPLLLLYLFAARPPADFPTGEIVTISSEQSLSEVVQELAEQRVVRSPDALKAIVILSGGATKVHSGDYQFNQPLTVFTIANRIIHGYFGLEPIRIRIPEGATVAKMADIFARMLPRFSKEQFIESALPLEGYLFPDTYFFLPNTTEGQVIDTLHEAFLSHVADIQPDIDASGHTLEEIVIMASLIEKEASNYTDRRMISGVLWNRINKNMLLQVDAAFLYIMGKATFDLSLKDLQYDSPYNTYRYKGLPPGPIGSPSFSAMRAAANPIKHSYLFYLADHSGVTHYSKTYQEHLRLKQMYLP
jgi:UPF0755 protein